MWRNPSRFGGVQNNNNTFGCGGSFSGLKGGGGGGSSSSSSSSASGPEQLYLDKDTPYIPGLNNIIDGVIIPKKMAPAKYTKNDGAVFSKEGLDGIVAIYPGPFCSIVFSAYVTSNFNKGKSALFLVPQFFDEITKDYDRDKQAEIYTGDGITKADVFNHFDKYYNYTQVYENEVLDSYKADIDKGKPVILVYSTEKELGIDKELGTSHAVVVVGYVGDNIIYADPNVLTDLMEVHQDYFRDRIYYTITINSFK